jgi:hypothetical protein
MVVKPQSLLVIMFDEHNPEIAGYAGHRVVGEREAQITANYMRGRTGSVRSLEELGRVRLSASFFMRDFLHSEIADFHGIPNIPDAPDLAIAAGRKLCRAVTGTVAGDLRPAGDRLCLPCARCQ